MDNVWLASALWVGLALAASLISIWAAMSVALVEIMVGAVAGNLIGLSLAPWVNFLAGFGAVLPIAHYVVGWPWPQAQIAGISLSTTSVAVVLWLQPRFDRQADKLHKNEGKGT